MELPKGRYPQSDTKAPAVRHCGTQSPTLRVAQSDTKAPAGLPCGYPPTEVVKGVITRFAR